MRVAFLGPVHPFRGGIAHYSTLLCRALAAAGHDVLLISFTRLYPRRLYPGQSDRDPSQSPLTVDEVQYSIDSLNPFTWLRTFWRIRAYRPDVVVLSWWTTFLAPAWLTLAALTRVFLHSPLVILCHNVLPHEASRFDRVAAKWVLGLGTRLIVQSEPEKQRLSELLPGKAVDVVPHPVYDMFASGRTSRVEARAALGLPQDVPVLLFFGIVRRYKGLSDVLSALPAIEARLGQVRLVVAGEFWEDQGPYLAQIERLGVRDLVRIDNRYVPNESVPLYFTAADLLVAPYHSMTGSGVVQMAVGFGLPVVTTVDVPLRTDAERALIHVVPRAELADAVAACLADPPRPRSTESAARGQTSGWDELVACIAGRAGCADDR